jgi:hypothetical protein
MLVSHPSDKVVIRMAAADVAKPWPMELRGSDLDRPARVRPETKSVIDLAAAKSIPVGLVGCGVPRYFDDRAAAVAFLGGLGLKVGLNGAVKISTWSTPSARPRKARPAR